MKLIDPCNRHLNYLRISITDRCNLKCLYCVPRDQIARLSHKDILTYEEILRLVKIGVKLGITKLRVTGGEPLVRKGVYGFLSELSRIDGLADLSLTTNGVSLKDNLTRIKSAGIKRINISLDTLKRNKFHKITGLDLFDQVWRGIEMARDMGFHPIKLNIVALNGINDDELKDMARLSFDNPFYIRFIEYMPIGDSQMGNGPLLLAPEIKKRISELGQLIPVRNSINDGPAQRYRFAGARGEVGFIHALSHHFCDRCNRLRLTASGKLRPCLLSDHHEDIKGPLREGRTDDELAEIFFKAVRHKPSDHNLAAGNPLRVCGQMHAIGG
ncbi:GTP 3',8-cyclase (EC [Olavius sp. associated proteobacterium Delta 1]|nr:GTP 3',8-cyclase (EC [Olavius sp. associated proteobacterium Delta 1]